METWRIQLWFPGRSLSLHLLEKLVEWKHSVTKEQANQELVSSLAGEIS